MSSLLKRCECEIRYNVRSSSFRITSLNAALLPIPFLHLSKIFSLLLRILFIHASLTRSSRDFRPIRLTSFRRLIAKFQFPQFRKFHRNSIRFCTVYCAKNFSSKKNWIVYYPNRETFWVSFFIALRNARICRDPSSLWYQHTHPIQVIPQ